MLRETIVPMRKALQICPRREHLRQTVKIALIVGTILFLINQADSGCWPESGPKRNAASALDRRAPLT